MRHGYGHSMKPGTKHRTATGGVIGHSGGSKMKGNVPRSYSSGMARTVAAPGAKSPPGAGGRSNIGMTHKGTSPDLSNARTNAGRQKFSNGKQSF